jgi:hypothetical protein
MSEQWEIASPPRRHTGPKSGLAYRALPPHGSGRGASGVIALGSAWGKRPLDLEKSV